MTVPQKVLAVSYEPWDTKVVLSVLRHMRDMGVDTRLLVGDLWQVERAKPRSSLITDQDYSSETTSFIVSNPWKFRSSLRSLQKLSEEHLRSELWRYLPLSTPEIDRIVATDPLLFCEERKPYYYPMSTKARLAVALLFARAVTEVFNEFRPSNLFMIDRNYLAKNVAAEIAILRDIPIHVIADARYRNYIWATSFWPSEDRSLLINDNWRQSDEPIGPNHRVEDPLYAAESMRDLEALRPRPSNFADVCSIPWRAFRGIVGGLRGIVSNRRTVLAECSVQRFRSYASSRTRVRIYRLLRACRKALFRHRHPSKTFDEISKGERYIFIPLHARPESSTLTLGRGSRDEDAVQAVVNEINRLNWNVAIYALENPSCIGDDRRNVYKFLRELGVQILSPSENTQQLILGSVATVAVSGTALLEADMSLVPSFAYGAPEFAPVLASWGLSLGQFLEGVRDRKTFAFGRSSELLSWFDARGVEGELGWNSVNSLAARNSSTAAVMAALHQAEFFVTYSSGNL